MLAIQSPAANRLGMLVVRRSRLGKQPGAKWVTQAGALLTTKSVARAAATAGSQAAMSRRACT